MRVIRHASLISNTSTELTLLLFPSIVAVTTIGNATNVSS